MISQQMGSVDGFEAVRGVVVRILGQVMFHAVSLSLQVCRQRVVNVVKHHQRTGLATLLGTCKRLQDLAHDASHYYAESQCNRSTAATNIITN